jgi:hypothetical protein
MFNSAILDVAIGMIFVYLLLSLMCSAANELIEIALKKRAIDLERGIRELLVPGSGSGKSDLVASLYNHPLVNGLFGGRYEDTRIASKWRYIFRTKLPTYIPSRSFALALMDLVLPGSPADRHRPRLRRVAGAVPPIPTKRLSHHLRRQPYLPGRWEICVRLGSNPLRRSSAQQALITLICRRNDAAKPDYRRMVQHFDGSRIGLV